MSNLNFNWDRITGIALIFVGVGVTVASVEYATDTLLVIACFVMGYGMGMAGKSTMAAPVAPTQVGTAYARRAQEADERGRMGAVDLERANLRRASASTGKQRPPAQ